jgi:prolipoprotein diacylglyceryltransferase
MIFPQVDDDIPRHPSQLYQAGLEGLLPCSSSSGSIRHARVRPAPHPACS